MAVIENWLILGMSCCASSKDPNEIRWEKTEAILGSVSGDFLVGFIAFQGHCLVCFSKVQTNQFHSNCRCTCKENGILFLRKDNELVLLPLNCRSITQIGLEGKK